MLLSLQQSCCKDTHTVMHTVTNWGNGPSVLLCKIDMAHVQAASMHKVDGEVGLLWPQRSCCLGYRDEDQNQTHL